MTIPWSYPALTTTVTPFYGTTAPVLANNRVPLTAAIDFDSAPEPRARYACSHRYIPAPLDLCSLPLRRHVPRSEAREPPTGRARASPRQSVPARTRRRLRTWER